jgi:Transcriptional regulatory protein, C terminal
LTKETFLNHLYGGLADEPEAKIIDVFICKLRKKLANASGGQDYIETVWRAATPCESQPSKRSQADASEASLVRVALSRSHTNRHGRRPATRFVQGSGSTTESVRAGKLLPLCRPRPACTLK